MSLTALAALSLPVLSALALAACGANSTQSSDGGAHLQDDGASSGTDAADAAGDAADAGGGFRPDNTPVDASISGYYGPDATPPDGSVTCGESWQYVWCDPSTQYCAAGGLAPPGNVECIALPSSCLVDRTCGCLYDAAPGVAACNGCTIEDSGLLYSGCFCP
jgi:hypothetical protein